MYYQLKLFFLKYRKISILITMTVFSAAQAAIYQQVDLDGAKYFSDTPSQNATLITLPPVNTFSASSQSTSSTKKTSDTYKSSYKTLQLIQPTDQQTFQNSIEISVEIQIQPALRSQDKLEILLDGKSIQQTTQTQLTLGSLTRGAHELQVKVVNTDGQSLMSSLPVMFYVQQTKVSK